MQYNLFRIPQLLFLDREVGESLDPRDDRTSAIRSKLLELLMDRMRQQQPQLVQQRSTKRTSLEKPPMLPPISISNDPSYQHQNGKAGLAGGPQLPPLNFAEQEARVLTPITEGDSVMTHGRNMSMDTGTITSVGVDLSAPDRPILDGESYTSSSPLGGGATPAILRHQQSSTSPWPPAQSPTPRASTSTPASSQSHSQSQAHSTRTEVPSGSGSADDTVKGSASDTSNTTPPTSTSPYSPKEKAVSSLGVDSDLMARTKSLGGVSVLSSPYSPVEDNVSILTSPHSVHDQEDQNRNSHDYQTFGKVSAELQAAGTSPPPTHIEVPVAPAVNANTSPSSRHTSTRKIPSQSTHEPEDNFLNEAGALFLMHQSRMESGGDAAMGIRPSSIPRQVPMPTSSDEEDSNESDDGSEEYKKPVASANTGVNVPGKRSFFF
jgi:CCR4-NOT transcriptional complex subunit CAF120